MIDKNGFPTERNVRRECLQGVYIIILHYARTPKNNYYLENMKRFLEKGEYHPFYYAWTYDQALMLRKEKPFFYCGVPFNKSVISTEDLKTINENRMKIGLEQLAFDFLNK